MSRLIPKKQKGNPVWAQPAWTYHILEEPAYEGGMLPEVDISAKPMSEFRKKWRKVWNTPIMVPAAMPSPTAIATWQYDQSNLIQTTPKQELDYLAGLAAPIAPYLTSAYFLGTGVGDMVENGVNVGNSVQVGLSSLPFAPYAISGVKQASPYIARGVDAGLSSLGNKGAKARIIGRELEKLVNETPVDNIASKSPQISFRTRVGDVEIDNPNLYYRQVGKGGGENFLTTGYAYTPQETENLLGYWNGTFKPTFRQYIGLDPGFTSMRPMYSQGKLWFPYGEGDLIVTSKPLRLANSKGDITSNISKAGSRRISEYKGEVTPENAKVFTFEPGYGYRRVENTSSLNISPKDISLAQQIESPISKPNFSDISHTKTSPSYGQQSTDKLIIRTTQDNGKIRLSLPTHTAEKPRQFVLESAGDNKFYVHMRTWDGDHIPANLNSENKQALFNALYDELPDGAEILFPKSGPGNYATRGTVAGLQRLARDPRFTPGTKGTLQYLDKDGKTIRTYEGTSFIKAPKITPENAASITPEQWTAAQDAAIARGDMAEAQRLRDLHFKVSAPNTEVKDLLYHGTNADFETFDANRGITHKGVWAGNSKDIASSYGKNIKSLYANFEKPTKYILNTEYQPNGFIGGDGTFYTSNTNLLKSADAVTYDNNGIRIPLGKRDNFSINDIRYGLLPFVLGGTGYGVSKKKQGGKLIKKKRI